MDNSKTGSKSRFNGTQKKFKVSVRLSIWLATFIVIVLILLFALTIYHARGKGMVEQYSQQQMTIAKGTAARIEDLLVDIEKTMLTFSKLPHLENIKSKEAYILTEAFYDNLAGKIDFISNLDREGNVLSVYPPTFINDHVDRFILEYCPLKELEARRIPSIYELPFLNDKKKARSVIVLVPKFNQKNEFAGAVIAEISLSTIFDRYVKPLSESISNNAWIANSQGTFVIHHNENLIGKSIGILQEKNEREVASLKDTLLKGKAGYDIYRLYENGKTTRNIVAYAPIHIGKISWSIVVTIPYEKAISPLRNTFIIIIFGAAGLILAVVVASVSLAQRGTKRLRLQEQLKRLQERDSWEEKLLHEKKTIEGIIEGSPIPIFVVDKDHKVILWNKACTELTGMDTKEMIGTDRQYMPFYAQKRPVIADLIVDRDFDGLEKYYGTKKVRKSSTIEGAYEARDFYENLGGKRRYLYFLAAPIYDEKGEIIAAIETLQDVTKEESMSKDLKEYAETLQNELTKNIILRKEIESLYNYLQSIVDSSPDKLFDLSSDGIINYLSRDHLKTEKGLESQQFKGKHFTEFVAPEHRNFMLSRWEEYKKGVFKPYEIEATAKDGTRRNLLVTTRPVKGTDRYVLVQRDITEFKNLEKKFYESQKLAAIGQLSAGIAHEIRNPLSSIKMSLQILEKRMQPKDNDLKRFKIAQREVEHLEELVNDVLIFAKPMDPVKESYDIRKTLEHALAMAEKIIADKHIQVEKHFDEHISPINVDPAMLEQAFLNIYRNAIDAMESNGKLTISTKFTEQMNPKIVSVKIEDDGCGIDEEYMPHIFNPFFTQKKYGTGLGLTQVKKILDLHQGTIDIFSKRGVGTKVVISLPVEGRNL
jgi:PAS domain S-box-containing protein